MSFKQVISLFVLSSFLSSCFPLPAPTRTATGTAAFVNVQEGKQKTNDDTDNFKSGKACTRNILYLINSGNSSLEAAKLNGGITKINAINKETSGLGFWFILPIIFSESCTIVIGE